MGSTPSRTGHIIRNNTRRVKLPGLPYSNSTPVSLVFDRRLQSTYNDKSPVSGLSRSSRGGPAIKVVTVEQMRALEAAADAHGLSYAQMMENAGRAVADWIHATQPAGQQVLVLVGPGNNGGDGLVAARFLWVSGFAVTVYVCTRRTDEDPNYSLVRKAGIPVRRCEDDPGCVQLRDWLDTCGCIVDALLGTGTSRPVRAPLKDILESVSNVVTCRRTVVEPRLRSLQPDIVCRRQASPTIVAVDVPSGLNCNTGAVDPTTLTADVTITFACPKVGLFRFPGAARVGKLVVADIGIPKQLTDGIELQVSDPPLVASLLPPRPNDAHKGTFGKVLVIAGCATYTGAARLSAMAAYRGGAGLVTLAIAENLSQTIASGLSEPTYVLLPHERGAIRAEAADVLVPLLPQFDSVLLGPGIGRADTTCEFVDRLLDGAPTSIDRMPALVIDADGLNALSQIAGWSSRLPSRVVLTPHPGEMARLLGTTVEQIEEARVDTARQAAQQWKATVILKGAYSVTASPRGSVYINPFAVPSLATAGSGDVLAGVVAALLAQGMAPTDAALAGAYLHGMAGQLVAEETGIAGAVAGDLIPLLPQAWRRVVPAPSIRCVSPTEEP
jgi:ADP-dependent NAD(P)H-hydrate dehydratase / NAD(P)H-hydrate epimerase